MYIFYSILLHQLQASGWLQVHKKYSFLTSFPYTQRCIHSPTALLNGFYISIQCCSFESTTKIPHSSFQKMLSLFDMCTYLASCTHILPSLLFQLVSFYSRGKQACLTTGCCLSYTPEIFLRSYLLTSQLCKHFFSNC